MSPERSARDSHEPLGSFSAVVVFFAFGLIVAGARDLLAGLGGVGWAATIALLIALAAVIVRALEDRGMVIGR